MFIDSNVGRSKQAFFLGVEAGRKTLVKTDVCLWGSRTRSMTFFLSLIASAEKLKTVWVLKEGQQCEQKYRIKTEIK